MSRTVKKRKLFGWKSLVILLVLVALPLTVYQVGQRQILTHNAAETDKPNIIVIMTDDQWNRGSLDTMPNTKKLAQQGMSFSNFFVTTALCCPSRVTFLTGEYAHNHGVTTNRPPHGGAMKFASRENETLPVWLQRAGYTTAIVGKYLNEYDNVANQDSRPKPGWDRWFVFWDKNGLYYNYDINDNGNKEHYGDKKKDYSTTMLADKAEKYIKSMPEPFFLFYSPHAPHGPGRFDNVEDKYMGTCDNDNLPNTPSFNERDVSDKPRWIKTQPRLDSRGIQDIKSEQREKRCMLKSVDDAVKQLQNALGNKKDNTVIIFTSDNGYSFYEHRHEDKTCMYEECVKVPLIISYPKLIQGGKKHLALTENVDLAPTILDLAGVPIPTTVNGKSLKPLLTDTSAKVRDTALFEVYPGGPPGDFGVRTDKYKYTKLATGEEEIYDLTRDEYELNNQINNPQYAQVKAVLSAQLEALKSNQVPPGLPGVWNPPNPADYYNDMENINRPSDTSDIIDAVDQEDIRCATEDGELGTETELGCVSRQPAGFAKIYYQIGLTLIGGLSLLFIITGGFLILTSQGRPQRITNGKRFILYALFGLLLSIFGYVFLEVIAIDILHLPGFDR